MLRFNPQLKEIAVRVNVHTKLFDAPTRALILSTSINDEERRAADLDRSIHWYLCRALMSQDPREQPTAEDKLQRYKVLRKLMGEDSVVDLTAEEIALCKAIVAKVYPPLVVGRSHELLESGGDRPPE